MTKGYPIFEWSPEIPIMEQSDSDPENEESSFHRNEETNDMAEYGEVEEYIREEQYGYSSDENSEN